MMKPVPAITAMIVALAGMIAWGLHLALIYAIATLACLQPQSLAPAFDLRIVSVAMTVILLSATAWYIIKIRKGRASQNAEPWRFLNVLAVALGLLALAAILWATLPVFIIADCRTQ
jgi:hypothetical protein